MNGMELSIGDGISPCFFVFQEVMYDTPSLNPFWSLYSIDVLEITEGYQRLLEIEITRDY